MNKVKEIGYNYGIHGEICLAISLQIHAVRSKTEIYPLSYGFLGTSINI